MKTWHFVLIGAAAVAGFMWYRQNGAKQQAQEVTPAAAALGITPGDYFGSPAALGKPLASVVGTDAGAIPTGQPWFA